MCLNGSPSHNKTRVACWVRIERKAWLTCRNISIIAHILTTHTRKAGFYSPVGLVGVGTRHVVPLGSRRAPFSLSRVVPLRVLRSECLRIEDTHSVTMNKERRFFQFTQLN